MNLRLYSGKVPIETGDPVHPIRLVEFPSREEFDALYAKRVEAKFVDRYYQLLTARVDGATLEAAAEPLGITRERARQIEARFLTLMRKWKLGLS